MEEKQIQKITEMLLAGGKMLGIHCGTCKSPLFEFEGKITCPICEELKKEEKGEKAGSLETLERVLHAKLNALTQQLEKEEDVSKTIRLLENIKATLEALERVKRK